MIPDRKYCTSVDFEMGFHSMNTINPKKVKLASTWVTKTPEFLLARVLHCQPLGTQSSLIQVTGLDLKMIELENFQKGQCQNINFKNGKI